MKKIISLVSAVVLTTNVFCVPVSAQETEPLTNIGRPVHISQQLTYSSMGAVAWLEAQVGKEIDYDNAFGVQCVDLAMAYYDHLGVPISRGNGDDYQDNALPEGWQRI